MSSGANLCSKTSYPGTSAFTRRGPQPRAGFVFFELILVLFILGLLAAIMAPRYYNDFSQQARLEAARSALSEGHSRLCLATVHYTVDNNGDLPDDLADLSPDYMNATESLGDYTAVYVQGNGEVRLDIYPGAGTSGTPLTSRSVPWP